MPKFVTLQTIEAEIAEGKLGIARDRLHGLISSYPADASLRSRLGDAYALLGYEVEAGRYWFLDAELDEQKQAAVGAFEKSCQQNPATILHRLRLRCLPDELSTQHARERVHNLIAKCKERGVDPPTFKRNARPPQAVPHRRWDWAWVGCLLVFVTFFAGIVKVIEWVLAAFGW